nr:ribosomal protein S8 [Citrullus lanatus]
MGKDTIANIITSIRNADMNRKGMVRIPSTNITENIVKILLREGFIENVRKHRESNKDFWVLTLRHRRNRKGPYKTILNLKRISRPGLRIYSNYQQIPRILGGMGIVILSTSRGIIQTEKLDYRESAAKFCVIYGNLYDIRIIHRTSLFVKKKKEKR